MKISLSLGVSKYKNGFKGSISSVGCDLVWNKLRRNLGLCKFFDEAMNITTRSRVGYGVILGLFCFSGFVHPVLHSVLVKVYFDFKIKKRRVRRLFIE